jgi:hypothetical protein
MPYLVVVPNQIAAVPTLMAPQKSKQRKAVPDG